jgi:hypothetical protein
MLLYVYVMLRLCMLCDVRVMIDIEGLMSYFSFSLLGVVHIGAMALLPVVGKHPDLMVGHPTSTVFPTNDRNFKRSQFFEKIFEKI